jgi:hypothetical protein
MIQKGGLQTNRDMVGTSQAFSPSGKGAFGGFGGDGDDVRRGSPGKND